MGRRLLVPDWAAQEIAEAALARWPRRFRGLATRFQVGENATYMVDAPAGRFVLRLHSPGRWSDDEIRTEHAFQRHLGTELGVTLPLPGRGGDTLQVLDDPTGRAVLVPFIPGRFRYEKPWPVHLRRVGAWLAAAHAAARDFRPGPRMAWDRRTLIDRPARQLREGWGAAHPSRRFPRAFEQAIERARVRWGEHRMKTGFCHADLHFGNVKFHRGAARVFDFDDCGRAPLGYDLAVPCYRVVQGEEGAPLVAALLAGYEEAGGSPVDLAELETLCLARELWVNAWVQTRPDVFDLAYRRFAFERLAKHLKGLGPGFRALRRARGG